MLERWPVRAGGCWGWWQTGHVMRTAQLIPTLNPFFVFCQEPALVCVLHKGIVCVFGQGSVQHRKDGPRVCLCWLHCLSTQWILLDVSGAQ